MARRQIRLRACATLMSIPALATPAGLDPGEEARWLRWLIPLPKQVKIKAKATLPAADIGLRLRQGAGDVERTGFDELVSLFKDQAGSEPRGDGFEILMGVCDGRGKLDGATVADAAKLAELPSSEQAYVIAPAGEKRLVLTALDERGGNCSRGASSTARSRSRWCESSIGRTWRNAGNGAGARIGTSRGWQVTR